MSVMCHDEKDESDAASYHAGIDPRLKRDSQIGFKNNDGVVAPGDEQLIAFVASTTGKHSAYANLIRFCEPMKQGLQLLFTGSLPLQVTT
jgi:hypothetical protein